MVATCLILHSSPKWITFPVYTHTTKHHSPAMHITQVVHCKIKYLKYVIKRIEGIKAYLEYVMLNSCCVFMYVSRVALTTTEFWIFSPLSRFCVYYKITFVLLYMCKSNLHRCLHSFTPNTFILWTLHSASLVFRIQMLHCNNPCICWIKLACNEANESALKQADLMMTIR